MLMSVVTREFEEQGFEFTLSPDHSGCSLTLSGSSTAYTAHVVADDAAAQVVVYLVSPQRIPVASRLTACEYVVRVNQGLRLGGFDIDMNDGEFRFRIGIDVEGGELGTTMFRTLLGLACGCMNAYHDGLLRVVYGSVDPETATAEALAAVRPATEHAEPASDGVDDLSDAALDLDAIIRELESDYRGDRQQHPPHSRRLPDDRIAG